MPVARRVKDEIREDRLTLAAGGLAFYALLAVFPGLIAVVSIYGLFADPSQVQQLISSVSGATPSAATDLLQDQLTRIVESSSSVLGWTAAAGIVGALWSASSGTQQLLLALDLAYDEEEERGFLKLRGMSILMTLGFVVLAIIALGLIVVIPPLLAELQLASGWAWAIQIGRFAILAGVVMLVLAAVYRYGPDRPEPSGSWVSWGAMVATILWIIASIGFSLFVANFGSFGETYGSLAGVIILMFWFYISGFVVLIGAEINAVLERRV